MSALCYFKGSLSYRIESACREKRKCGTQFFIGQYIAVEETVPAFSILGMAACVTHGLLGIDGRTFEHGWRRHLCFPIGRPWSVITLRLSRLQIPDGDFLLSSMWFSIQAGNFQVARNCFRMKVKTESLHRYFLRAQISEEGGEVIFRTRIFSENIFYSI